MIPPSSISSSAPVPEASSLPTRRGAFFLLEGVDRCGKTTQCARLVQRLVAAGLAATAMRFPDRSTATGAIINNYLQQTDMALDDRAIHLLFSANRWESAGALASHLRAGVSVVCDRYAYSGVAFSAAKINPVTGKAVLDMEWCQAPDRGLPAPDCVIFLDLSLDEAEQRGGYGGERYEEREMQTRVRERFRTLQAMDENSDSTNCANSSRIPWKIVNAAQSIEQVEAAIWGVVCGTLNGLKGHDGDVPLNAMWQEENYAL